MTLDPRQVKRLIDERVHGGDPPPSDADAEALDAHLAANPDAAADLAELERTRAALADIANDSPTNEEIEQMWSAIAVAAPGGSEIIDVTRATRRRTIYPFLGAAACIAATLAIAFHLGRERYGVPMAFSGRAAVSHAPTRFFWQDTESREVRRKGVGQRETAFGKSAQPQGGSRAVGYPATGVDMSAEPEIYLGAKVNFADPNESQGSRPVAGRTVEGLEGAVDQDGDGSIVYYDHPVADKEMAAIGLAPEEPALGREVRRAAMINVASGTDFAMPEPPPAADLPASAEQEAGDGRFAGDAFFPVDVEDGPGEGSGFGHMIRSAEHSHGAFRARVSSLPGDSSRAIRERFADRPDDSTVEETARVPESLGAVDSPQEAVTELGWHDRGDHSERARKLLAKAEEYPEEGVASAPTAPPTPAKVTEAPLAATALPPTPAAGPQVPRKIIKTGDLTVEVPEYDAACKQVEAIAAQHGGEIADVSTREETGGAMVSTLVIRVDPENFEALFAALKTVGRVEAENVKAADVTAEYVDLEARIHSLQIAEASLRELLTQKSFIDKISSMLEVERELNRVRSEIEQMQGRLRVMAARIAQSTIRMTLREPSRTVPTASLSVEVPALEDARKGLGASLETLGGRLLSGKTSKRDDGTMMGHFNLQVSLADFDALLVAIDGLGRVESRQVKDHQFGDGTAPWAKKVQCPIALVLYERSRQLPSGQLALAVDELAPALKQLEPVLAEYAASILSNRTTQREDGSSEAELAIKVPAGRFADLVATVNGLGRATGKAVSGEAGTIAGGAANVLCDVKLTLSEPVRQVPSGRMALQVGRFPDARRGLSKLVSDNKVQVLASSSAQRSDGTWSGDFRLGIKAADMEKVVKGLEDLGEVKHRQVQGLGLGDLSQADPKALGVIQLALFEKPAVAPPSSEAGGRIRDRLRDGLTGLYASLGLILYGLVVMAPWLVIVAVAAWLSVRYLRKRRPAVAAATVPEAAAGRPGAKKGGK